MQAQMYDEAVLLSKKILETSVVTDEMLFRMRMQRALIYEILLSFENSKNELQHALQILKKNTGLYAKYYPLYLITLASFHRVQQHDEEFYRYITEASNYASKINNYHQLADINMLLAFYFDQKNPQLAEKYYLESLQQCKKRWPGT